MKRFAFLSILFLAFNCYAECRIAYDFGSSGIRSGNNINDKEKESKFDFLESLWKDGNLDSSSFYIQIETKLDKKNKKCIQAAGGMSVWRLFYEEHPDEAIQFLKNLYQKTNVPVFIVPSEKEGIYGYRSAKKALGNELKTKYILDIGGGSFQIAAHNEASGVNYGQKTWNRFLCKQLKNIDNVCNLSPMSQKQIREAKEKASWEFSRFRMLLPPQETITAISKPVTIGIASLLNNPKQIVKEDIENAINDLAQNENKNSSPFLLSNLFILQNLFQESELKSILITDVEINNVDGMLLDNNLFAWSKNYKCYLDGLQKYGLPVLDMNPNTCSKNNTMEF